MSDLHPIVIAARRVSTGAASATATGSRNGRRIVNVVPRPTSELSASDPPCLSTMTL